MSLNHENDDRLMVFIVLTSQIPLLFSSISGTISESVIFIDFAHVLASMLAPFELLFGTYGLSNIDLAA